MPTLPQSKWTHPPPFIPVCSDNNNNAVLNKRSQSTSAMISKEDQKSWLKIECTTRRNARQCYTGLQEACGECALPYCTVARWVKTFKEGQKNVTDMPRPGILHDNARVHAAGAVTDLLNCWIWEVLYHPCYFPDLSPCDYDPIPKMKESLHGTHFRTFHDDLHATDRSLRKIQKLDSANCIQQLPYRWERVIYNSGGYIEGLQNLKPLSMLCM